jgi:hypothetical protein
MASWKGSISQVMVHKAWYQGRIKRSAISKEKIKIGVLTKNQDIWTEWPDVPINVTCVYEYLRKKSSTQLLRECWSFLTKLMTCQNLQNKLLNITVLFIWYLLASLKKMSLAKHGEFSASGHFGWRVTCTLYSPVWRITVVRQVGTWKRSPW